jgi:acyl carrier protein
MKNTMDQLKQIIAQELDVNIDLAEVDPDASLLEDGLGLDSIAIVELVTLIEERFAIQFGEDDLNMEAFASVRTLSQFIEATKVIEPTKTPAHA